MRRVLLVLTAVLVFQSAAVAESQLTGKVCRVQRGFVFLSLADLVDVYQAAPSTLEFMGKIKSKMETGEVIYFDDWLVTVIKTGTSKGIKWATIRPSKDPRHLWVHTMHLRCP